MNRLETRITKMEAKSGVENYRVVRPQPGESEEEARARHGLSEDDPVIFIYRTIIHSREDLEALQATL